MQQGIGQIEGCTRARCQLFHALLFSFNGHRIGIVGAGLNPGDIALFQRIGIFPQGQQRQLLGIKLDRGTFVSGFIHYGGKGLMILVRQRLDVKHHFIEVFCRALISLPVFQTGFGIVIKRTDLRHRSEKPCAFFQNWRAEVAVIDNLVIVWVIGMVSQHVMQAELIAARYIAQFRPRLEIGFLEGALFDQTADADFVRGRIRHLDFKL